MKTVFDKATRDELIRRIHSLHEHSPREWGKMNIRQMVRHCTLWEEMVLGKRKLKRSFPGRIFGRLALKASVKDDRVIGRNMPSGREIRVREAIDSELASDKNHWISLIEEYGYFSNYGFIHPFFGEMTKAQIGYFAYKHSDHHLRQFNS